MYVCICNAITDTEIRDAAASGADDLWALQSALGVAAGCGSCKEHAMDVVREARQAVGSKSAAAPRRYVPAA